MAPPPPRPPIICYDMQTNSNARPLTCARGSLPLITGVNRRPKVTVIQRDLNELKLNEVGAYLRCQNPHRNLVKSHRKNYDVVDDSSELQNKNLNSNQNIRFNYDNKLKRDLKIRKNLEDQRNRRLAMQARLDEISARLESAERFRKNLCDTIGMSHCAARDMHGTVKSTPSSSSSPISSSSTISISSSSSPNSSPTMISKYQLPKTDIRGSRISSYTQTSATKNHVHTPGISTQLHSPLNTQFQPPRGTQFQSQKNVHIQSPLNAHTRTPIRIQTHSPGVAAQYTTPRTTQFQMPKHTVRDQTPKKQPDFSFYKGNQLDNETLEITDIDFYDKIEDRTMIEVNGLLNKMQSALRDLNQLH